MSAQGFPPSVKNDYGLLLTRLASFCTIPAMLRFKDIVTGLAQQTIRKCEELEKDLEELNRLRAAWQRYQEVSKQIESKQRMVAIGHALVVSAAVKAHASVVPSDEEWEREAKAVGELNVDDSDISEFSLWRIIREVMRQTTEIRAYELVEHLKQFGLNVTRPAIESALATHPKEFRIAKRGREKFVSLK